MAYLEKLFDTNFLEYASYVIKERAIPHLDDGLKPVQRRILHCLFEMDDGSLHKVANVVGRCMQYHPHGDQSIYSALVTLANKELLIDRQGNFGNLFTGDPPSASRYIECRALPLAKKILYNPPLTSFTASYDGRRQEPVTFPAKLPLVLILGSEGIAVGMSTRILPHNFTEVLQAEKAALQGKPFSLYPDCPSGGIIDVSEYREGNGKIIIRAKLDTSDPKKIVVKELPYGTTTESLILSIEAAAQRGKIKIGGIVDYTSEKVEIEIKLPRGTYAQDLEPALYAFTECEIAVGTNLLVIAETHPKLMSTSEVISYHAKRLLEILIEEFTLKRRLLEKQRHLRTLEMIFIQEKIYKKIENAASQLAIYQTMEKGFEPFLSELFEPITKENLEHLLQIPIRRISRYDREEMQKKLREGELQLKEIDRCLKDPVTHAIHFIDLLIKSYGPLFPRRSQIQSIERIAPRQVTARDLPLLYCKKSGYLGTSLTEGKRLLTVSPYDRLLLIFADGSYQVKKAPDKLFLSETLLHCGLADKATLEGTLFSLCYRQTETHFPYLKRFKILRYLLNKPYRLLPKGDSLMRLTTDPNAEVLLLFEGNRSTEQRFSVTDYSVKSVSSKGTRLRPRRLRSARFVKKVS